MATATDRDLDVPTDVVRWRARAASVDPPMRRQIERSAICLSIGEATGLSEGQVQGRLSAAETVRDQAPSAGMPSVTG